MSAEDAELDALFGEGADASAGSAAPAASVPAAADGDDDEEDVIVAPQRKRPRTDDTAEAGSAGAPTAANGASSSAGGDDSSSSSSSSDSDSDSSSSDSDSDSSSSSSSSSDSDSDSSSDSSAAPRTAAGTKKLAMRKKAAAAAPAKGKKVATKAKAAPAARPKRPAAAAASESSSASAAASSLSSGQKKAPGAAGAGAARAGDESGDEYASEHEEAANADDEAFIDREGDDEELVREYDDMKQDFRDVAPDGLARKKGKKKPAPKRRAGDIDSDDDAGAAAGAEEKAAKAKAKGAGKRKRELSDSEKLGLVRDLLSAMADAAAEDRKARKAGQPAVHKLKMLDRVRLGAANTQLQAMLLEGASLGAESMSAAGNPTILSVLRDWLRPLPGSGIPALQVREAVYDIVNKLPIRLDDLRTSRIGEVLFALAQHPEELPRNRELLLAMIDRFSRSIFAKRESYRGNIGDMLEQQQRLGLVSARAASGSAPGAPAASASAPAASADATAAAGGAAAGLDAGDDADFGRLLGDDIAASLAAAAGGAGATGVGAGAAPGGAAAAAANKSRHAKIPTPLVFDFVVRPEAQAIAPGEKAGKQKAELTKRLADLRRTSSKGVDRGAKMSIEGRGM